MSAESTVTLKVSSELDQTTALQKAEDTTQLDERNVTQSVGGGIKPPYSPATLASFSELNETHATCIAKKARWEVGFGFNLLPATEGDDEASDDELETLEEFWFGSTSTWRAGPRGTPQTTPTEVLELARKDYRNIGWLALEILVNNVGEPVGLAHVPATTVRVRRQEDADEDAPAVAGTGYVQEKAGKKRYYGEAGDRYRGQTEDDSREPRFIGSESGEVVSGSADELDGEDAANELIFMVNPSPIELYYGIPDWIASIQTIIGDQAAKDYNRDFFENSAIPRLAVKVKGGELSKQSRQDLRDMIHGVKGEAHRTVILEVDDLVDEDELRAVASDDSPDVDIEIEPLTQQNEEDMSFSAYRELNEHEITKVHEVPKILIQRTGSSNRSNSKEQIRDFAEDVIAPEQEKFAARLTEILHKTAFQATDWRIEFVLRGGDNRMRDAEIAKTRVEAASGLIKVDEVRRELGLDPLGGTLGESLLAMLGPGAGASMDELVQEIVQEEVGDMNEEVENAERIQRAIESGTPATGG